MTDLSSSLLVCRCFDIIFDCSCHRCQLQYPPDEVAYRYCVALTVTDLVACADVVVFGASLDSVFGVTASELHRYVQSEVISRVMCRMSSC